MYHGSQTRDVSSILRVGYSLTPRGSGSLKKESPVSIIRHGSNECDSVPRLYTYNHPLQAGAHLISTVQLSHLTERVLNLT